MPQGEVWIRTNASHAPLKNYHFYLTAGEKLRLKLVGLRNGQHLILKPMINTGVVSIQQAGRANQLEQTVTIIAHQLGRAAIAAYEPGGNPNQPMANCYSETGRYSDCFPHLYIEVISKMEMPKDLSEEQRALLYVLLAETQTPMRARKAVYDETQAFLAMTLMRHTLLNRLSFSHPHYLDVPKNNPTLMGVIRSGAIAKFENYPALPADLQKNINGLFAFANTGQHPQFLPCRRLIQHAISVAKGEQPAAPMAESVYAWRTEGSGSPGSNFRKLISLAGQEFYGLQQSYIDSLKKGKK